MSIVMKNSAKSDILEIVIEGALQAKDFEKLTKVADDLIKKHGKIRVLIDAIGFVGWQDITAAQEHFGFVKDHYDKVKKIGIVAGYMWQHWIAAMAHMFLHIEIKVLEQGEIKAAREWVKK